MTGSLASVANWQTADASCEQNVLACPSPRSKKTLAFLSVASEDARDTLRSVESRWGNMSDMSNMISYTASFS